MVDFSYWPSDCPSRVIKMGIDKLDAGGTLQWTGFPSRGEYKYNVLLDTACEGNWDKLWPKGALGLYANLTYLQYLLSFWNLHFVTKQHSVYVALLYQCFEGVRNDRLNLIVYCDLVVSLCDCLKSQLMSLHPPIHVHM